MSPTLRLVRTLAMLARLGLPLSEGLRQLGALPQAAARLEAGDDLASLVSEPVPRAVLQAAQESGSPELMLARLGDFLEDGQSLRRRVSTALLYPKAILAVLLLEALLLVVYVFPALLASAALGYNRVTDLARLSALFHTPVPTLVVLGLFGGLYLLLGRCSLLDVPWLGRLGGGLAGRADQALWCRSLALLLPAQPLPRALELAAGTLAPSRRAPVAELAPRASRGDSLSQALESLPFDPMVKWAVAAGETRQSLAPALEDVAEALEREVRLQADLQIRLLEPVALVLVALPVLLLLISFWWPYQWLLPHLAD